jgi:hypothetical protein
VRESFGAITVLMGRQMLVDRSEKRNSHRICASVRVSDVILFIILFAFEDYACLLPDDTGLPLGLRYSDVGVILAILWSSYIFISALGIARRKLHFLLPILLAVLSTALSAMSATYYLGQPFLWGILPFRRMYAAMFLVGGIVTAVRCGILTKSRLIRMMYIIGGLELLLFTAQDVLANSIVFLAVNTSEIRFGLTRLRVPFLLPLLLGIISFNRFLNSPNRTNLKEIAHLVFSVWSVLFVAFICQHRAPTLILLSSYLVIVLLWRGDAAMKVLMSIAAIFILLVVAVTPLAQTTIDSLNGDTSAAANNTLIIRADAHDYYLEHLQGSPLLGFGWPNSNYVPAALAAGEGYKYYLADNGIFGFAYMLGGLGLVWLAILYIQALKLSWRSRQVGGLSLFQYFLFETGNLYMGIHWFYYYPMPFMLAVALVELQYDERGTQNNE